MSNLYGYFVNPKTVSYITSEYIDVNNIDASNTETINKIQIGIKKALDDTFSKLDTSKISGGNVNDAIQKFVNVTMKRLDLQPRSRNVPAQASMRMPPQHSTNTRLNNDESLESRSSNYMQSYREFAGDNKPAELPEWLQSQSTNPKRLLDEQNKKMSPSDMFKNTSTRKMNQVFNDSEANPTQDIEDYSGNLNFSYFNDTPEITSAFDDAFYSTGIDPASVKDENDSIDIRLKKIESERNAVKIAEQKVENIEELFKNDNEFKKHLNMSNKKYHHSSTNDMEENINKLANQPNKVQQNLANQNRMNPNIMQRAEHYNQEYQQQQQQQQQPQQQQNQQIEQYINNMNMNFMMKEKQYQDQIQLMQGKLGKLEEYLKTLMLKYTELRDDRDLLKERFKNNPPESNVNQYAINAIEDKKRELLQLSASVQEKINRLEELQSQEQN
jgi:hypothetical protein